MKLKLYRNVRNISLYKNYVFYYCCLCTLVAMALKVWLVPMATKRLNLWKNLKKKLISSEAISGMKLCRNIHNSSLYKNCVFYRCCLCTLVAMATSSFHWLVMGKMKIGIYCYLSLQIFWRKKKEKNAYFRNAYVPLPNIFFFVQTPKFNLLSWQLKD